MAEDKAMVCPFCGWTNEAGEYEMLLVRLCRLQTVTPKQVVLTAPSIWKPSTPKGTRRLLP